LRRTDHQSRGAGVRIIYDVISKPLGTMTNRKGIAMNLVAEHPTVTAYLEGIAAESSPHSIDSYCYGRCGREAYQLGALKAQLHMLAEKYPVVAEELARCAAYRKGTA
jgi:hypothetical protein